MNALKYFPDVAAWLVDSPLGSDVEVLVGGDPTGPDGAQLQALASALSSHESNVDLATRFLDEFVDRDRFAGGVAWSLVGVTAPSSDGADIRLDFSIDGDPYGNWGVSLKAKAGRYYPIAFTRQNI